MNNGLLDRVLSVVLDISALNKKTVFSISTTSKQESEGYLTPVRIGKDFALTGCVVFDRQDVFDLLKQIDGKVDVILADGENLLPKRVSDSIHREEREALHQDADFISQICFNHIEKSEVFIFKPSDLTVDATWMFVSQRMRSLSGKKVSILGSGNIGSKLALKLAECGADVQIFRRNSCKGKEIALGLNQIKSTHASLDIKFCSDPIKTSKAADVLIGSTNGCQVIDKDIVNSVKKTCLIIDLGKNNLSKDAIDLARKKLMEICRADVTPALESYIYEIFKMQEIFQSSYGSRDLGFCTIVGGGFFGNFGDIVVDKVKSPSRIFGVSQGDGTLKSQLNMQDESRIERLYKEIKTTS